MAQQHYLQSSRLILPILITGMFISCKQATTPSTTNQTIAVKDSVLNLAATTVKDLSAKGPISWLDHFEDSPNFFMANDGSIAFPDYKTAGSFIKTTLIKQISSIKLKWSNIRVDSLSTKIAVMGANYHEDMVNSLNKTMAFDGYFTATVLQTDKGWKFRDVHWSGKVGK